MLISLQSANCEKRIHHLTPLRRIDYVCVTEHIKRIQTATCQGKIQNRYENVKSYVNVICRRKDSIKCIREWRWLFARLSNVIEQRKERKEKKSDFGLQKEGCQVMISNNRERNERKRGKKGQVLLCKYQEHTGIRRVRNDVYTCSKGKGKGERKIVGLPHGSVNIKKTQKEESQR